MSTEISTRVPDGMITELGGFVEESDVFTSRAEFLRHAIREKLDRETGE